MDGGVVVSVDQRPWQGELCQFFTRDRVARYCLQQLTLPLSLLDIKLLEPAAGHGAFFLPLVPKLIDACRVQGSSFDTLRPIVRAYEIDTDVAKTLVLNCVRALKKSGVPNTKANEIARYWVRNEDFLEARIHSRFSHIVGNPPYIRWEAIPLDLRKAYRKRYPSFKGRADLYVAFIDRALGLLAEDGQLGFLCPGAWTRNGYGGSVREALTSQGHIRKIVDFGDVDSFEKSADAHPCFFVFQKNGKGLTQIYSIADGDRLSRAGQVIERQFDPSANPLLLSRESGIEKVMSRAREKFSLLEDAGCVVRVGSATGCNSVFLGTEKKLGIEKSRLLKFVNARSISDGQVEWSDTVIVNVFDDEGKPVKLSAFPKLKAYLQKNKTDLKARAKASKSKCWWRSIDVLHPDWHASPKLLVVDISAKPVIGLDEKGHCAGSGVYQIKSTEWPLRELQVLLSAGVLGLFVAGLSARVDHDFHRFQKKHICTVRVPKWRDLDEVWRSRFQAATARGDLQAILRAVAEQYECEVGLLKSFVARDWKTFSQRPRT